MYRIFLVFLLCLPLPAAAHFGLVLPQTAMVNQEDGRSLDITFAFLHPFEQFGMPLAAPARVTLHANGAETDLTGTLTPMQMFNEPAFRAEVPLARPGAYTIAMEPQPDWEPAEDAFIIHYTKTVIGAFGDDTGWDMELGLPTEIVPLTRPFGLWHGNTFRGVVKAGGAPIPGARVEIEYWNTDSVAAPSDVMITQTVISDTNGVFAYTPPGPGWRGFAALTKADYTLPHKGVEKPVELGGVIWVHFEPWP